MNAVVMKNITKQFPGVLANDSVNLEVREGEILSLVGENGAGKSTLMNILYGLYVPDEGEIYINEQKVQYTSTIGAIEHGIGMVPVSYTHLRAHETGRKDSALSSSPTSFRRLRISATGLRSCGAEEMWAVL